MSHIRAIRLQEADQAQENRSWYGGVASGARIYAYAGGDPINHADPSGLSSENDSDPSDSDAGSIGGPALGGGNTGSTRDDTSSTDGSSTGAASSPPGTIRGGGVGWTNQSDIDDLANAIAAHPGFGTFFGSGFVNDATAAALAEAAAIRTAGTAAGAMIAGATAGVAALLYPNSISFDEPGQYVVRAGIAAANTLQKGTGFNFSIGAYGFSVQSAPGLSIDQLSEQLPGNSRQISYATIDQMLSAGVPVAPSAGYGLYHATAITPSFPLSDSDAARISGIFTRAPNPSFKQP